MSAVWIDTVALQKLTIEQWLLIEVVALSVLLILLRIRRSIKLSLKERREARAQAAAAALRSPAPASEPAAGALADPVAVPVAVPIPGPVAEPASSSATRPMAVPADEPVAARVAPVPDVPQGVVGMPGVDHSEPRAIPTLVQSSTGTAQPARVGAPAVHALGPEISIPPLSRPAPPRVKPADDDTVLSPDALLARARTLLDQGSTDQAAHQFRLCVRLAGKLKQRDAEAAARLELGDIARSAGDMTTACEHWQMARGLYADLQRSVECLAAETRMERAGCPTDWVLTGF